MQLPSMKSPLQLAPPRRQCPPNQGPRNNPSHGNQQLCLHHRRCTFVGISEFRLSTSISQYTANHSSNLHRHWRHISAFHGPWLQMPFDMLELLANINYQTPRPRPTDPAIFFDLIKIHRLVDEATNLAVKAASDMASPTLTNVNGDAADYSPLSSLGFGGPVHGAKLSRERKFRMREQASQKLARAYRLNEILCSVATMQSATPLEQVGATVLQRNAKDPDAQYVHFFHEKIPSRQVAEYTSLEPLTDILMSRSAESGVLRTRATVKVFKEDFSGAVQDLTHALSICRLHEHSNVLSKQVIPAPDTKHFRKRLPDTMLPEKDQPSSLEGQLLFQRGSVYLTMACNHVAECFPPRRSENGHASQKGVANASNGGGEADLNGTETSDHNEESKSKVESRKLVKTLAKRALKDYMTFLSHFDYSPNLPVSHIKDFNERVNLAVHANRPPRSSEPAKPTEGHIVYPLSDLFAAVTPPGLPPYPSQELIKNGAVPPGPGGTCEWATYHPLLTDALHSLLLCHCLVQTSAKELQRHANMVARVVRLCDGYPIFQASRSPARSDWYEVLHRANNWLDLSADWDVLCASAPLPLMDGAYPSKPASNPGLAASAAAALISGNSVDAVRDELAKGRAREQAIMDALEDERVTDIQSFRAAVRSREKRAELNKDALQQKPGNGTAPTGDYPAPAPSPATPRALPGPAGASGVVVPASPGPSRVDQHVLRPYHPHGNNQQSLEPAFHRWAADDSKDYPILTERAAAVALWIRDAPLVTGTTKRKKRTKKSGLANSKADDDIAEKLEIMSIQQDVEADAE